MKIDLRKYYGTQKASIENSQIVDRRQVLKILENYITELYDEANRPENLEVESKEEVDENRKGTVKWIKLSRKGTGNNGVPGEVLRLLGEEDLKIATQADQQYI
jgi:hypothetical protein